jgi:hypothetical protein
VYQIGVKGALDSGGDLDFFNLGNLQVGDRLSVTLSGTGGMRGTLNDCYLQIFRLNGGDPQLVTFSDDEGPGYDSLVNRLSIPADDTYYVEAMSYPASGVTGTYDLGVFLEDVAGSAAPLTGGGVTGEAARTRTSPPRRRLDELARRRLPLLDSRHHRNATDADVYRFHFTAGDVVSVVVDSTSQLDGRLSLLDAGGVTVIAQEDGTSTIRDDAASALDSRLYAYAVPTTGDYFVRVQGVSAATGTYRLDVNLSTNTAPPAAAWFSGLIGSDVGAAMRGISPGAFVRVPFVIGNDAELADVERLTLAMKYDDGFVAYLNGTEIARRNAPDGDAAAAWDAAATSERDKRRGVRFRDDRRLAFRDKLVVGVNLLAVHGLSRGASDPDFLVLPEVRAVSPLRQPPPATSPAATPGKVNGAIGAVGSVADTRFDHDRGFYSRAVRPRHHHAATEGATIRYTLNGDAPTATTGTVYTGPIHLDTTTTIRALAFKPGYVSTNVDTADLPLPRRRHPPVVQRRPAAGCPRRGARTRRRLRDGPDVVNNVQYRDTIKNDLQTIPTMSLVMGPGRLVQRLQRHLRQPEPGRHRLGAPRLARADQPRRHQGLPSRRGRAHPWRLQPQHRQSQARASLLLPQRVRAERAGLPAVRPRRGAELQGLRPAHVPELLWSFQGDARGIFMRDQLSRDLQLATGQPAPRGNYYHLYINGQYWGLYNTDERPRPTTAPATSAASRRLRRRSRSTRLGYSVEATDGNLTAWTSLWNRSTPARSTTPSTSAPGQQPRRHAEPRPARAARHGQPDRLHAGRRSTAATSTRRSRSFINNNGGPTTSSPCATAPRRAAGLPLLHPRRRAHAARRQPKTAPARSPPARPGTSNPHYFFQRLWRPPTFKLRVADRIQKHMVDHGGVLTPAKVRERVPARAGEIDRAVVAESARWGDCQGRNPAHAQHQLAGRGQPDPQQLHPAARQQRHQPAQGDGLWPPPSAPRLQQVGGTVAPGFR